LKIAFNRTGDQSFLQAFHAKSQDILNNFLKPATIDKSSENAIPNANENIAISNVNQTRVTNKNIVLVVATRYSEAEFHTVSATGKSLQMFQFPNVTLRLFPNNSTGLPKLYNEVIQEFEYQDVHLVFAHDDLHFLDLFWPTHLQQGLAQYDLVGIVGNKMRHPLQPSWAFIDINGNWDKKENLSGSVAHGQSYPPETCAEFGPVGPVKVLDGLLLAASSNMFKQTGMRFDEQFSFHFYDLDLCRQAEQLQLKAGTIPFSLMHESKGSYNNQSWLDAYKAYVAKWLN
jgi:GT2 family glycosyltransferase